MRRKRLWKKKKRWKSANDNLHLEHSSKGRREKAAKLTVAMPHNGEFLPLTILANLDLIDIDLSIRIVLTKVHSHKLRNVLPIDLAREAYSGIPLVMKGP